MAFAAACAPAQPAAQPTSAAPAQAAKPAAQDTLKVRIGFNKTWTTPFLLIAKNQDYFSKNNVQVEWVEFASPPQAIEALAAGAVDSAVAPVPNYVTAFEKGVPAKVVMHLSGWSDPNSTYFVRADSDIKTVSDLKGKKIGVNNYGGNFDLYLRHMLEANGLDPKKDVQILEVPIPSVYQALQTKQIDAGVLPALFVPVAEEKFPGQFKPLFTFKDIPDVKDRPQFNQLILAMTDKFIKDQRPSAKAFMKSILDAQTASYQNPKAAAEQWASETGLPGLALLKDPFGPDTKGKTDGPAMALDIKLMNKYGYAKSEPAASAFLDESIVDEVNAGK